jgi:hypothetical protein
MTGKFILIADLIDVAASPKAEDVNASHVGHIYEVRPYPTEADVEKAVDVAREIIKAHQERI